MRLVILFGIGLIFGLGISIAGMANPAKVLNFFDIAGNWDPSLLLVLLSALVVTAIGYRLTFRRPAPVAAPKFYLPSARQIDAPLVLGSLTFGVGWGLSGLCPGGAVPAIGIGDPAILTFILFLMLGILAARLAQRWQARRALSQA